VHGSTRSQCGIESVPSREDREDPKGSLDESLDDLFGHSRIRTWIRQTLGGPPIQKHKIPIIANT
jgi:hypothetical protein